MSDFAKNVLTLAKLGKIEKKTVDVLKTKNKLTASEYETICNEMGWKTNSVI